MSRKRTTFDLMMVLTHVTRGQPLNEHVFEVSLLCFNIVSFKRFYDEYLVGFFFTVCWSLNFWMIFSLPKRDANLCVFGVGVCVCVHPLNKDFSKAVIGTFYQSHFQKMVGWVALSYFFFMLKFKSFKMWRPMSLYFNAILAQRVKRSFPYRKGMSYYMYSLRRRSNSIP